MPVGRERYLAALGLASAAYYGGDSILTMLTKLSAEEVWAAPMSALAQAIPPSSAEKFHRFRCTLALEEAEERLSLSGLQFVAHGMPGYPEQLTDLTHPPAGLFVRGDAERLAALHRLPRITIVGTRRASAYGTRAARELASAFAARGIVVVSGMALGIDARSHEAALESDGLTVAVLGCGADVVYPRRHRDLYQTIAQKGLVLSELPPGTPPTRYTFPNRNRLLGALGDAVLMIEGAPTSGAMQTADRATSLGRHVFAVPGSIYAESHRGCNLLIRDGATPAIDAEATVEEFLFQTRIERGERQAPEQVRAGVRLGKQQDPFRGLAAAGREPILEAMTERPCSIDALVLRTGLTARALAVALAELELAGLARRAGPGLYIRAP
jgi:DNA processing protein